MCPPAALRQLDVRLAQNIVIETRKNLLRKLEFVWLGNSGYKLTTGDRPANTDRIKKDKAELRQYSAKAGKARTAYRIKFRKKDYILWKQRVRRIEAVASQHHKTGTQKGQGPRDYEVEWEGYKEREGRATAPYCGNGGIGIAPSSTMSAISAHYCDPPFHADPGTTCAQAISFYLVSSPHAKAPGPVSIPSWASAQRCARTSLAAGARNTPHTRCASPHGMPAAMLVNMTHPAKSQLSSSRDSSPQTPRPPKKLTATEAMTPASAPAPSTSPTPSGLHYAVCGGGVVYGSITPALAQYNMLQASTGAASLLTTVDPHHAAHFAAGHDHEEAKAPATGEHILDRLLARPVFRLGSSPLHVLAERRQTLIRDLRDTLRELTIAPHEAEDSDDLWGDDETRCRSRAFARRRVDEVRISEVAPLLFILLPPSPAMKYRILAVEIVEHPSSLRFIRQSRGNDGISSIFHLPPFPPNPTTKATCLTPRQNEKRVVGAVLHLPFPTPQRAPEVEKPADHLPFPTPPKPPEEKRQSHERHPPPTRKSRPPFGTRRRTRRRRTRKRGEDGGKEAGEDDVVIRYQLPSSNPDDDGDKGEGDNEGEDGKDEEEEEEEEEEKEEEKDEDDEDTEATPT
ncbi:hypothetical protein DFH09DRAFT_1088061 [Mycena vulgaris]|nr:hypothetical protein DFH09DRAFT_1088061 [Mycena vulgaris]